MRRSLLFALAAVMPAFSYAVSPGGRTFDTGARYATDAYPGFDQFEENTSPQKKEPKWLSWITGPKCDSAAEQLEYCEKLISEQLWSKAVAELDALVRQWHSSSQAPRAQQLLAEVLEKNIDDSEEAFKEYRYLIDFYSLQIDYNAAADSMYRLACKLRIEGKTIVFFRFKNTVDVRRAFEACVLRAPGAEWAAQAMLIIAELREEEGRYTEAIKVYENLRNIRGDCSEAKQALVREAEARMKVLSKFGYNRERVTDTLSFLESASLRCDADGRAKISTYLSDVREVLEEEAFQSAKFYDSRMRTKRSAIAAYEEFLSKYPAGKYSSVVRSRLEELKKGDVK